MTQCPYCIFQANNVDEEIQHMEVAHPEVIQERRRKADSGQPHELEPLLALPTRDAPPPRPLMEWLRAEMARANEQNSEYTHRMRKAQAQRQPGFTNRVHELDCKHHAALARMTAFRELLSLIEEGRVAP